MFTLHPQLANDTFTLGRFELSLLLLMNDSHYPWCILVPQRGDVSEIYQLDQDDQRQLLRESSVLGEAMMRAFRGDKLNIAALGNVVPQLHVHHVVRFRHDAAWPAPVWGKVPTRLYTNEAHAQTVSRLREALASAIHGSE